MSRIQSLLSLLLLTFLVSSCSKKADSINSTDYKEDTNNFFTATFNGKTLKTSGFIFDPNGSPDDISGSISVLNASVLTQNTSSGVSTEASLLVSGSTLNFSFGSNYKIPIQQLDAKIYIERFGNTVGTYKISDWGRQGIYTSAINDLTGGNKKYELDPATTTVTITAADALYIQGSYNGRLIDGTSRISVTGNFKLRKF